MNKLLIQWTSVSTSVSAGIACLKEVRTLAPSQASLSHTHDTHQSERGQSGASDRATEATCDSLTTVKVGLSAEWSKIYGHTFGIPPELRWDAKRGMFTSTRRPCRRRGAHQITTREVDGGNKMFTREVGDWIRISHSTFTRCTSLPQRWPNASGYVTLVLKMTRCQTLRTNTPSSTLSIHIEYIPSHTDIWWKRQMAFYKSNATLPTLHMSSYHITIKMTQFPSKAIKPLRDVTETPCDAPFVKPFIIDCCSLVNWL